MESVLNSAAPSAPLTGFWRRLAAFVMDWIVLALVGNILGQVLFEPLAAIGAWDRVVGFVIALVYFGWFDSGRAGSGTPGKRVAGLVVVDKTGRPISLLRSVARAALLTAPFLFNSMSPVSTGASLAERAVNGLGGGLVIAALYYAACNRRTRQGLHDLATGTFVVYGSASQPSIDGLAPWRPHMLIVLFLVATGVPASMAGFPVGISFAPSMGFEATQAPHGGVPEVRSAFISYAPPTGGPRTCQYVTVGLRGPGVDDETLARRIGGDMARRAHCHIHSTLPVRMYYGFDLGFAAGQKYRDYVLDEALFTGQP